MLYHGSPDEIIQKSIDSIEIEPELLTLQRIEETISSTKQLRQNKIATVQDNVRVLSKQLNSLKNEMDVLQKISDYNYEILSKLGNESTLGKGEKDNIFKALKKKSVELDNMKVSLAKNLNDLESSINSLNLNKNTLEHQIEELKIKFDNLINSSINTINQDSKILKINIYRNLGIKVESFDSDLLEGRDKDQIIIYNKEADMSSMLRVDEKYSDFFISNYIWDRLD
ncbi:uncharacterized protein PRCAT00001362001 [Priceomyces carsonii]|uniref:uncharacterized protein n=1 Tax=Priceomyces carsonii TaxID=28549 RepID=UPI002ED9C38F|nr:unnamed protein product [Priceomyces carsonii]